MLNFLKTFFYIYWDNHMIFTFQFVNVAYHTCWFADTEKSLHPWDKSKLIVVHDLSHVLLDSVASILLRIVASVLILAYNFFFFFLWYLCLVWVSVWGWPHRMSFGVFLPLQLFGKSFRRIGIIYENVQNMTKLTLIFSEPVIPIWFISNVFRKSKIY